LTTRSEVIYLKKINSVIIGMILIASILAVVNPASSAMADPPTMTLDNPKIVDRITEFNVSCRTINPVTGTSYPNVIFRITMEGPLGQFPQGTTRAEIFTITNINKAFPKTQLEGGDGYNINNTFTLVNGKLVGYYGYYDTNGHITTYPNNYDATTWFTVKMAETAPAGDYKIKVEMVKLTNYPTCNRVNLCPDSVQVIASTATGNFKIHKSQPGEFKFEPVDKIWSIIKKNLQKEND